MKDKRTSSPKEKEKMKENDNSNPPEFNDLLRGMTFNLHGFSTSNHSNSQKLNRNHYVSQEKVENKKNKQAKSYNDRRSLVNGVLGQLFEESLEGYLGKVGEISDSLKKENIELDENEKRSIKDAEPYLSSNNEDWNIEDIKSIIENINSINKKLSLSVLSARIKNGDVSGILNYFFDQGQVKGIPESYDYEGFNIFLVKAKELRSLWKTLGRTIEIVNEGDFKKELISLKDSIKEVEDLDKELNKLAIVERLTAILKQETNPIDFMLLNEMNTGMDAFKTEVEISTENKYKVAKGPMMKANGGIGQIEYYPLVYNAKKLEHESSFYVGLRKGKVEIDHAETINWKKIENQKDKDNFLDHRPIIVHQLKVIGKEKPEIWLAGVHTTPEGTEFERVNIYKQLAEPLKKLKERAELNDAVLVIGGDYYIAEEARVISNQQIKENKIFDKDGNEIKRKEGANLDGIRNLEFVEDGQEQPLNFTKRIAKIGLSDKRPITGTNQNSTGLQVADYFVVQDHMKDKARVGLLHPESNQIYELESEEQDISKYWLTISDHLPVMIEINPSDALENENDPFVKKRLVIMNYLRKLQNDWRKIIIEKLKNQEIKLDTKDPTNKNLEEFLRDENIKKEVEKQENKENILKFVFNRVRPLNLGEEENDEDIPREFKELKDEYQKWLEKNKDLGKVTDSEIAELEPEDENQNIVFTLGDFEKYLASGGVFENKSEDDNMEDSDFEDMGSEENLEEDSLEESEPEQKGIKRKRSEKRDNTVQIGGKTKRRKISKETI